MQKVELLAPAENLEQLKLAIISGADAVYIGGQFFRIESTLKNFSKEEIILGIEFAHSKNRKVFVAINIIPHNEEFKKIEDYLLWLEKIGVDAIIISEPGVLMAIKNIVPNMQIHLSSQANTTNYQSAKFWYNQGIKRVVVSSEMSLEEISEIRENTPLDMDIEAIVHGDVCISHSGRKLVSNYLEGINENYNPEIKYNLMEEKRPGEYFPIYEDDRGTFFFNTEEVCMIDDIPTLIKSGITSLRLEARMKESEYISKVVKIYREAIDKFYEDSINWCIEENWLKELRNTSNRSFTKGFYSKKIETDYEQ